MTMDMYTMLPGKIVSYDGTTAVVRPAIAKLLATGEVLEAPQIVRVAVKFPMADAGRARVTVPLKPGDDVELTFSCRSLENWLNGADSAPDDPRQFDLSDCFCTPVMRPAMSADTENLVVAYGAGEMKISPSGRIIFSGPGVEFEAPVTFKKPVTTAPGAPLAVGPSGISQGGKSIGTDHAHTGVRSGSETSGGVA